MATAHISDLDSWIELFNDFKLPILDHSFKNITREADNSRTGNEKLIKVILKDPALSLQTLRLANCTKGLKAHTVTEAVNKIGVDGVLSICISVVRLSAFKDKTQYQILCSQIVKSYHAAKQSDQILPLLDCNTSEETFIACLLLHIGEMCFWSRVSPQNDIFYEKFTVQKLPSLKIELDLLGTSFRDIGHRLAEEWDLGDTLRGALSAPVTPPPEIQGIILSDEVSNSVADFGWNSPEFTESVSNLCTTSGLGLNKARALLIEGGREASEELTLHGVRNVEDYLPDH